jgi:hypothetical protein
MLEPFASKTRRSGMPKFAAVLAAAVTGLMVLTACAQSSSPPRTSGRMPSTGQGGSSTVLATFPAVGLSFRHPAQWRSRPYEETSSFTDLITFLSTDRLHAPCTARRKASATVVSCGPPLARLSPTGVLITWMSEGMPGLTLAVEPGLWTRIGGRQARVVSGAATDVCAQLGGTWQERVAIARDTGHPTTQLVTMSACVAAPGVVQAKRDIKEMLATVRV